MRPKVSSQAGVGSPVPQTAFLAQLPGQGRGPSGGVNLSLGCQHRSSGRCSGAHIEGGGDCQCVQGAGDTDGTPCFLGQIRERGDWKGWDGNEVSGDGGGMGRGSLSPGHLGQVFMVSGGGKGCGHPKSPRFITRSWAGRGGEGCLLPPPTAHPLGRGPHSRLGAGQRTRVGGPGEEAGGKGPESARGAGAMPRALTRGGPRIS